MLNTRARIYIHARTNTHKHTHTHTHFQASQLHYNIHTANIHYSSDREAEVRGTRPMRVTNQKFAMFREAETSRFLAQV